MIEIIAIGAGFVALAVAAFLASIRLGILVGRRIDSSIEARAAAGVEASETPTIAPTSGAPNPSPDTIRGREEQRGE